MKHFSGQSRGHGGQSVGRGGDHEERVGVLAGFEMTEGGVPVRKHVRIHGKSAEGLEEQGRNETPCRGRERGRDMDAAGEEKTQEFGCFVAGHGTRHAEMKTSVLKAPQETQGVFHAAHMSRP